MSRLSTNPHLPEACRLAINDESQQGGHAGFTILATCLLRECLQIFTGDREQTRAGTFGDQLRESSLKRLSHKSIGFFWGSLPRLPSEMVASFASALADETTFSQIGASGHDPFPLLAALTSQVLPSSCHPTTVFAAEGLSPLPASSSTSFSPIRYAAPLTLILRKSPCITHISTAVLDTVITKNHLCRFVSHACRSICKAMSTSFQDTALCIGTLLSSLPKDKTIWT